MAQFEMDFPDDFLKGLLESDFDEICEEGLNESSSLLVDSVKKETKNVIIQNGDSELVNSVTSNNAKKSKNGAWIVNVFFKGYSKTKMYTAKNSKGVRTARKYSVSNALKSIWLEYGVAGRQSPRPFLNKSIKNVENTVIETIQTVYNEKVGSE